MSAAVRAALNADRTIVMFRNGTYRGDFPVEKLDHWLTFYRGLWARGSKDKSQPGPWAEFYRPTIEARERVKATLRDAK